MFGRLNDYQLPLAPSNILRLLRECLFRALIFMKVTIIGAGSAAFSIPSIRDLCIMESAPGSTFTLVDVNKDRLDAAYGLATKYAKELGAEIKFEREMDRRRALQGADYVINTAFASGHDYTEKMRAVGEQHGYYRGIDSVEFNFVSDY